MIAEEADAAISSIDYHFHGLERLLVAAQEVALAHAENWIERRLAQISAVQGQSLTSTACAAIVAAVIDDWSEGSRMLAMAWRESSRAARNSSSRESHARWTAVWRRFWSEACRYIGLPEHGEALALFFDGECAQHLLRWNRALDRALLDETVGALINFLSDRRIEPAPVRSAYRAVVQDEHGGVLDVPGTPADPLEAAAAEILATQGISALTFRAVAERAGTTLGSASYHFQSKHRMVRRAFEHLYRGAAGEAAPLTDVSADDLLTMVVQTIAKGDQPILRAFDEITQYISRSEDYAPLRGVIRSYRDPAATWLLEALLDAPGRIPSSLAGAFSSICRGLDHLSLAAGSAEAERIGSHTFGHFTRL
jgi:AcrR family transcriptional regulator